MKGSNMAKESGTQEEASQKTQGDRHSSSRNLLGPILCWAVVFADIGTSVYYVPGILWGTLGITTLAGFFVFLTMAVFVLLTLKYAEVSYRFPQGGGVVTVASQAINHWVGALGGMFILVDYFLTAAISCLSGMLYLSVVIPGLNPIALKVPRRRTAGMALLLVVLTIGLTSPLLTMLSTVLQPAAAADLVKNGQLISLLAGHWGNIALQTEVAISASALLVFASNTAIIGSYHVFMALARMEFFPAFILKRNNLRGT